VQGVLTGESLTSGEKTIGKVIVTTNNHNGVKIMLKVITNNVPRDLLMWSEIPESARADFDYIKDDDDRWGYRFFCYRGQWYDAFDFMRNNMPTLDRKWDGFNSDSFFSGIAIRYVQDYERVVVALVLAMG
jgi:hypothetical protein